MTLWEHYYLPTTVDAALAHLGHHEGRARVVGGGTDLLLELQQGHRAPVAALVDVTRVAAMTGIVQRAGRIYVGAGVSHAGIAASPRLARAATCLVESCGMIGGPQVRNVATLGGNVAHALPAGDGTLSLLALDAEAEVACQPAVPGSKAKKAWRPISALYLGPGTSAVDPTRELIVRFRFRPAGEGEATAFRRVMRPQGVALPILGVAVWLQLALPDRRTIEAVRIALGPAGPTPMRAAQAEAFLVGQRLDDATLAHATSLIAAEARLRTSVHRATSEYRRELLAPLVGRALRLAEHRARTGDARPEGLGEGELHANA